MKKNLLIIFLSFFISCGGSTHSLNNLDYPLSKEKAYSKTSNIYINLPVGWFVAEDNDCNCTDLWIVKSDYSESITFRKINVDESTLDELNDDGLDKITYYNKTFVRAKFGKDFLGFSGEEVFEIKGKIFSAYVYRNDKKQIVRTVVFKHYDKFFESEAIQKASAVSDDLYKIQNAVLSTLN